MSTINLTEIPVVIFAHHFSKYLPLTFQLAAKDSNLLSSGICLTNNVKWFRKFMITFSAIIRKELNIYWPFVA